MTPIERLDGLERVLHKFGALADSASDIRAADKGLAHIAALREELGRAGPPFRKPWDAPSLPQEDGGADERMDCYQYGTVPSPAPAAERDAEVERLKDIILKAAMEAEVGGYMEEEMAEAAARAVLAALPSRAATIEECARVLEKYATNYLTEIRLSKVEVLNLGATHIRALAQEAEG